MAVEIRQLDKQILQITYNGTITDDDVRQVVSRVEAVNRDRVRFATLVDSSNTNPPNAKQRRMFTEGFERLKAAPNCYVTCVSMYTRSAMVRSVLTALAWVVPPPFPMKAFGTLAEAEAWARSTVGPAPSAKPD